MKLIRPITVTDAVLTSSTVVEAAPAAYAGGANYDLGDTVGVAGAAGAVAVYVSLQAANLGHVPASSPTWWKPIGTTYAAHDPAVRYNPGDIVLAVGPDSHRLYESLPNGGPSATINMFVGTPGSVTWGAHGMTADAPVIFSSTGVLPAPIVAGVVYYARNVAVSTFEVAASPGGPSIAFTSGGTGVLTGRSVGNIGHPPATSPTWWLDLGADNRWAMFDGSVTSQTSAPNALTYVFAPGRIDTVALLNASAASARVTMTDPVEGVVYDRVFSMISDGGITDWYGYFFEPVERLAELAVTDLPPYAGASLAVTLTDAGNTVLCGACVLGMSKAIGGTQYGTAVGIQDYSVKQRDDFGNYSVRERAFAKRASFRVFVKADQVDRLLTLLAGYRATPIVYIGSESYAATIAYGFYKDFNVEIAYPEISVCSLEIEGLT